MIEVKNLTARNAKEGLIKKAGRLVFRGEGIGNKKTISVVFLNTQEIKRLNLIYRQKNKPTDVLSFSLKKENGREGSLFVEGVLGEIVLCPAEIKKSAKKSGLSFEKELARAFIHGLLHLFGYDHQNSKSKAAEMEAREDHYLTKLFRK